MRHFAIPGYSHPVLPTFAPCGRLLYGFGWIGIAAWDLTRAGGDPVWDDFDSGGFLFRVAVSPCGRYVAGAEDRCVLVWDTAARTPAKRLRANPSGDHISDVAFTPDGAEVLTACVDGAGGVRRWRCGSWRRKRAFATRARCDGALAVSPDGRTVATAATGNKWTAIKLWRLPAGTHRKTAACDAGLLDRLAYSPDGSVIAARDGWERLRVYDARTLSPVATHTPTFPGRKKSKTFAAGVGSFAFHPSGRYLAVTGGFGPVEFLDTRTWRPAQTFDWKHGVTHGVSFSPDGTLAAAGGAKGKIVVWDVDV